MDCPACQTRNKDERRFCMNCGAPLPVKCANCGFTNDPGAQYCGGCGNSLALAVDPTPVPEARAEREASVAERRQLTVMFSDLVGSTELSTTLDPEDLRDIIRAYQDTCGKVIAEYDGYIARYMGDGIMVYFGYPQAHEDDAERAVHAGLDIVEAVSALSPLPDVTLQVRVGIATGRVVVGDVIGEGASSEKVVVGETPNLAARLQGLAQPDTVVIAPATRYLLGTQFEYEDLGEHTLKGLAQPLRIWRVLARRAVQSRFEAVRAAGMIPLVDRVEEVGLLQSRWDSVLNGSGQIVLVGGEAGIGKSRLARVLVDVVHEDASAWAMEFQCSPYHTQSALYPVIEFLQQQIYTGSRPKDDAAKWAGLEAFLDNTHLDIEQALPLFANLLTIPFPAGQPPLTLTSERQRHVTQQYLLSLITELTQTKPVVLLLEDLHWADPSTLELVDFFVEQVPRERILALFTHRPEFTPPWSSRRQVTSILVDRLQGDDAIELVRQASGTQELAPEMIKTVVEKTDGVPLYLEEFTKTVVESHAAADASGGKASDIVIPSSLHDSLLARLDRLGKAKGIAQLAAMLGREFSAEVLQAVWTEDQETLRIGLQRLVEAEFIYPRGEPPHERYLIKHALIQDAAYESLLKSSRVRKHQHIAGVMEARFPDIVSAQPELLAQHYAAGKVPEKAVQFWLTAGQQTLRRNAHVEAIAHLHSGLAAVDKLPATPERALTEINLQIALVPALLAAKGYGAPDVELACTRALQMCDTVGDVPQKFFALFGLWTFHVVRANHATSLEHASRFFALAEAAKNDDLLLEGYLIVGIAHFFLGDFAKALSNFEQCIKRYERERHGGHAFQFGQDPAVIALNYLSWIYWLLGDPKEALRRSDEAVSLARDLNHPFSLSFALSFAGWHRLYCRDRTAADEIIRETVQLCTDQQIQVFLAHGRVLAAWSKCEAGNLDEGIVEMQAALDYFRATGSRCFLPYWDAFFAMAHAAAGNTSKADEVLAKAIEEMEEFGERWSEPELHRYRGMLLHQQGAASDEVERCHRQALEVAQRQGTKAWALRAATSLAEYLSEQGKRAEARAVLQEVLSGFPPNVDGKDFDDARRLLAVLVQK